MHHAETDKSTSTVRLVRLLLPHSDLYVFGAPGGRPDFTGMIEPGTAPYVLFPEPSAPVLDERFVDKLAGPITLIVPDGTWKQARKITHHLDVLRGIPRLRLAPGAPSRYMVRRNQREGAVCTIEAIARVLGAIEGVPVQAALERYLDLMVERVLWSRRTSQLYEPAGCESFLAPVE
jgi:DTW domain-containing protein YfiP